VDPRLIESRRHAARIGCRCVSFVAFIAAAVVSADYINDYFITGWLSRFLELFTSGRMPLVLVLLGVGAAGAFLDERLSRWIVPWPRPGRCPRCGYNLRGIKGSVCPECGADGHAATSAPDDRT
jgi:hypothetical protein